MAISTLSDLDLTGRRVFMRVDFDVPLTPARGLADPGAIAHTLPSLRRVLDAGARLVVASDLGLPGGRPDPSLSLLPVGAYLAEALGRDVLLTDEPAGDGTRKVIADLREGQIALLENLRFAAGEEANEESFARALASYGDVYVNDAFATLHRRHASVVGMVKHVSQRGMGPLVENELAILDRLRDEVARPFVVVAGGSRVAERLSLIGSLIGRIDALVLGGAMATTFLRARGAKVGRSTYDEEKLPMVRDLLVKAERRDVEVWLPRDVVAAEGVRAPTGRVVSAVNVPDEVAALDIGPESVRAFSEVLLGAKTILWTGPLGAYESEGFAAGTIAVGKALATAAGRGALSIATGRHTAAALRRAGIGEQLTLLSTGGTATLEFIEGRKLPGLVALETP